MNLAVTLVYAYGTSEGLRKAWDARGRGRKVASQEAEKIKVFYHGTVLPSAKKMLTEGLKPVEEKAFKVNWIPTSKSGYVYVTNIENEARAFAEVRAAYDKTPPGGTFRFHGYEMDKRPAAQKEVEGEEVPAVVTLEIPEKVAAQFQADPDQDSLVQPYAFLNKGIIPKEYIKKVSVMNTDPQAHPRGMWKEFTPDNCCEATKAWRRLFLVYYGPMAALKMHLRAGQ